MFNWGEMREPGIVQKITPCTLEGGWGEKNLDTKKEWSSATKRNEHAMHFQS